jgi:hypothetical protein
LKRNIGFALISSRCVAGDRVEVVNEGRSTPATLRHLPFL